MIKKETKENNVTTDIMNITYNKADEAVTMTGVYNNKDFDLEFEYGAGGQRIKKVLKDGLNIIASTTYVNGFYTIQDGNINKHISDGAYIIATKVDNNSDNILYYTQNNIGSTSMLTDKNGDMQKTYLYTPYGEEWVTEDGPNSSLTDEVVRLFTGQIFDKETGLYYYNARYYDPKTGIFITPDPAMSSLNHYAYCSANPIKYTDPTGLDARSDSMNAAYAAFGMSNPFTATDNCGGANDLVSCANSMISAGIGYDDRYGKAHYDVGGWADMMMSEWNTKKMEEAQMYQQNI
jgi:RHS repeat-associated protein